MQVVWSIHRDTLGAVPVVAGVVSSGSLANSVWYGALRRTILGVDRLLQRYYGVRAFTDDPACLLRVAPGTAATMVRLADETRLLPRNPILELHLWNEQLPRRRGGDGLGWAVRFRTMLDHSLRLLATEIATDPALADIRALRADTAFVTRGRGRRLARIATAYGFAAPTGDADGTVRLHRHLGEDLLVWALALACNPLSLRGKLLRRERHELWISRDELLRRYGAAPARDDRLPASVMARKAAA